MANLSMIQLCDMPLGNAKAKRRDGLDKSIPGRFGLSHVVSRRSIISDVSKLPNAKAGLSRPAGNAELDLKSLKQTMQTDVLR